jgi:hypothetical protein
MNPAGNSKHYANRQRKSDCIDGKLYIIINFYRKIVLSHRNLLRKMYIAYFFCSLFKNRYILRKDFLTLFIIILDQIQKKRECIMMILVSLKICVWHIKRTQQK